LYPSWPSPFCFFINLPTGIFLFPIHLTITDCNASVYPPLLHSLIDSKWFFFHKQEDAKIFKEETFHEFSKEDVNQVHSCLPSCQTGAKAAGSTDQLIISSLDPLPRRMML
jgi:hypothetical protein